MNHKIIIFHNQEYLNSFKILIDQPNSNNKLMLDKDFLKYHLEISGVWQSFPYYQHQIINTSQKEIILLSIILEINKKLVDSFSHKMNHILEQFEIFIENNYIFPYQQNFHDQFEFDEEFETFTKLSFEQYLIYCQDNQSIDELIYKKKLIDFYLTQKQQLLLQQIKQEIVIFNINDPKILSCLN